MSRSLLWLMAAACGLSVANIYYCQPLLASMAQDFGRTESQLGIAASLSQVGFAVGLLFIVPLGDVVERRRLIVYMLMAVSVCLVAIAVSGNFTAVAAASLAVGVTSIAPQLLVPLSASLAVPAERGRVVGFVMSGLLIGILLSRTVSGWMGAQFGWRSVYWSAAGLSLLLALVLSFALPHSPPAAEHTTYRRLLASLIGLFRQEPTLRQSCIFGGCAFGAFSAFWTTLSFFLAAPPYGYDSTVVGLFGLAGAAGALAAPLAGRLADSGSPRRTIGVALAVGLASYGLLWLAGRNLIGLIAGVLLLDLGVAGSHISNQTRVYSLNPGARNRLTTVYMFTYFVGGAAGGASASAAWSWAGWDGVCLTGGIFFAVGLALFAATSKPQRSTVGAGGGANGPAA